MSTGDLVLTPNWTWHGHANEGTTRAIWFDGLDAPINGFYDAWFIEHGEPAELVGPGLEALSDETFTRGGLRSVMEGAAPRYSPMFRYPYTLVDEALATLPAEPDGSRKVRYVNPVTGGAIMPTMDAYMLELTRGMETRPFRTTANTMCVVAEGEGTSTIGSLRVNWRKGDVFTLPHWTWFTHTAASSRARLFQSSDRDLVRYLGYLRDEVG